MNLASLNRYQASFTHLLLSAIVLAIFFLLVFFVWYPAPYFYIEGTHTVILLLIGVDLVIGPLLTLVIFKPGKPGLKLDLSLIVVVQITALLYGAYTIHSERPYFVVFNAEQFTIVPASELGKLNMQLLEPGIEYRHAGPSYVYIDRSSNLTMQMFKSIVSGPPIEHRPEFYKDFKSHISSHPGRGIDIEKLAAVSTHNTSIINALRARHPDASDLGLYPIQGKRRYAILVVNHRTADVIDYLDINPWTSLPPANPAGRQ